MAKTVMELQDDQEDGLKIHLTKNKKRKLKKGETDYPKYDFKTIEEIFNALTPQNMNRFFRDFKTGISASVHMRELTFAVAKDLAEKEGIDMSSLKPSDVMKMPTFTWIDD
jgi:hypothetical protein